ncbi:MAG: nucleotide exchange factor GrpE [Methylocystaceae bacterium]|nr:nucleotide exchange factor GrpE [Methylocystaceae bacterium]NBV94760.1 nucleotide exchange factor GrpE [Methylocystaceae bacterium]
MSWDMGEQDAEINKSEETKEIDLALSGQATDETAREDGASGDDVAALKQENADLKDRVLRALAEAENIRRRAEREVSEAKLYGAANFAREMLTFADNLRRAIESVPQDVRSDLTPSLSALLEGVELTEKDFLSRLGRFGVKPIEALGARFDPNQHEALFEIPDETKIAGTVAQVVEQGYLINDRVLRPAKVGVARGGPKS